CCGHNRFFFSSRRRHTRFSRDWSSDVCSSDLVAQERYTRSGGILAVRVNEHVGPLPAELPDRRGRFDTIGRTVYFAERATTAFAEVLQDLRAARVTLQADADAIGMSVEEYITEIGRASCRVRWWRPLETPCRSNITTER